ncbi:DUF5324 family protein [Streptacidiphilus sp. P02-A3a]|uniref:DUF5324 family protein n=1 Tax=Streptacidiphilus sp. P02-A3a TaxID=2704468 RepID=UPI0015FA3DD3|nr:DUF5324 family protein [Streptacidiphilus sp. P02-A3a]QMU66848.1 DUF5324 family protein [Streptacidiphilus sp. P02-A3a]
MTRIDAAREAAGKTREQLVPYAASARDAAAHYTDEAWQRLAPHIESAVMPRVVPLWEQARASVPPSAAQAATKAAEQAKEAARSASCSARAAAVHARQSTVPAVSQALDDAVQATAGAAATVRDRGAAVLPVLRGQISAAEIEALTAQHARAAHRGRWTRRVVTVSVLGAVAGGGVVAWKWWQRQSNPDWLVEPPVSPLPLRTTPATGPVTGSSASSAGPLAPEDPAAERADTTAEEEEYDVEAAIEAEIEGRDESLDDDRPEGDDRA